VLKRRFGIYQPKRLGFTFFKMKNTLPATLRIKKRFDANLVAHGAMSRTEYLLKWYRISESLQKQNAKKF
jgi:hypothetical protein